MSSLSLKEVKALVRADESRIGKVEAGCFGSLKPEWHDFQAKGHNIRRPQAPLESEGTNYCSAFKI